MRFTVLLGLLGCAAFSAAGTWNIVRSGGTATASPHYPSAVQGGSPGSNPWISMSAPNYDNGTFHDETVSVGGPLTFTCTWSGATNETPPQTVLIHVVETATYSGDSGVASTDFNGPTVAGPTGTITGDHWEAVQLSGTSFTRSYAPTASAKVTSVVIEAIRKPKSGSASPDSIVYPPGVRSAYAEVFADMTIYTPTITLGGATTDGNGVPTYLIGQKMTASVSLNGLSPSTTAYSWQTPAGTPFKDYTPGVKVSWTPASETAVSTYLHFAKSTQNANMTCTVTTTNPSFTFDVQSPRFNVATPTKTLMQHDIGYCDFHGNGGQIFGLWNASLSGFLPNQTLTNGMYRVYDINCSAPFSNSGNSFLFAQLINSGSSYIAASNSAVVRFFNPTSGLDNQYPYPFCRDSSGGNGPLVISCGTKGYFSDGPYWDGISSATELDLSYQFQMFVMFRPGGTGSADVPLTECDWTCNGATDLLNGQWSTPTDHSTMNGDSDYPTHPQYTNVLHNGTDSNDVFWSIGQPEKRFKPGTSKKRGYAKR